MADASLRQTIKKIEMTLNILIRVKLPQNQQQKRFSFYNYRNGGIKYPIKKPYPDESEKKEVEAGPQQTGQQIRVQNNFLKNQLF